jgi:hypothetical protein
LTRSEAIERIADKRRAARAAIRVNAGAWAA